MILRLMYMMNSGREENTRRKTCCLTGHRDIQPWEEQKIRTRLHYQVLSLLSDGVRYFGVGGAQGFDMLAAEYLLDRRDKTTIGMKVISVLPYPEYREDWPEKDVLRQDAIIRRCDKVVYVCPEKEEGAFLARDRKLVDESSHCICYCHRRSGGTAYTVRYAMGKGIPVYNTSSWDIRQLGTGKR